MFYRTSYLGRRGGGGGNFKKQKEPVLIPSEDWDIKGVADPYVIEHNKKYYMYYLGVDKWDIQILGVAYSKDGIHWTKYADNPIIDVGVKGTFDEKGLGEPSVIYEYPNFYMFYTGRNKDEYRNIGTAVSRDGVNWKKLNYDGIFEINNNLWDGSVICDTTFIKMEDNSYRVYYGGGNIPEPAQNLNGKIGMFSVEFGTGNIDSFDVRDNWQQRNIKSTEVLKGSYEIETLSDGSKFAWLEANASIKLKNKADLNQIEIKGFMPMDIHKKANVDSVELKVWIDGKEVYNSAYTEDTEIEIILEKSKVLENPEEDYITIEFQTTSQINQFELGLLNDNRNLSWRINSIYLK